MDTIHETSDSSLNLVSEKQKSYDALSYVDEEKGSSSSSDGGSSYGAIEEKVPHCHDDSSKFEVDKRAVRKLVIATILCLLFMVAEIIGGIMANSLALATDAAHMLTDLISFIISLVAMFIASRARTKTMCFGYYRAEVMGALISTIMIWVVTGILLHLAVQRVINMDYEIDAKILLVTSSLAIVFNIIMAASLGHTHSHGPQGGHSHSHDDEESAKSKQFKYTEMKDTAGEDSNGNDNKADGESKSLSHDKHRHQNINVRAAFIHVIGDFLQSVGVFIAALIIYFKPEWKIADPICTFLFSILVIITTITVLRDTMRVLMEGTPQNINYSEVKNTLMSIRGVREVHDIRLWSLTINKTAFSAHIALSDETDPQTVLNKANSTLKERYGIHESTIQVEAYSRDMQDCTHCQDPDD